MQLLYQLDQRGADDAELIREGMREGSDAPQVCQSAFDLAMAAWECHGDADRITTELAPDWPTHRQPPVDRAIIRLAHYEMVASRAPVGVAINEAIELAKQYGAEQSPAFVNGVLDKMARGLKQESRKAEEQKVRNVEETEGRVESHGVEEVYDAQAQESENGPDDA